MKTSVRISAATRQWIDGRNKLSDRERSEYAGRRLRYYFLLLDFIRKRKDWVSVTDCRDFLQRTGGDNPGSPRSRLRQARRIMFMLEAAGMAEIQTRDHQKTWIRAK